MNLLDLTRTLETTPVQDVCREVKIVVMGEDGEPVASLGIARLGEIQEWGHDKGGRRQLQYKMAIVTEPMRIDK